MSGSEQINAGQLISAAVLAWPGTSAAPHRFGGIEYRVGSRQLGHVHGDSTADIPLLRALRDELVAEGRARPHRWRPDSGWVTIPLSSKAAVEEAIRLLRFGYDRAIAARERALQRRHRSSARQSR